VPNEHRIIPNPTGLNAEFFAHCARGELRFQRCSACNAWRHPPRYRCGACGSGAWTWERSSGRGRVFSWTVTHQALDPAFAEDAPYAVVVVELEEGPRLVGNLVDLDPADLELDLPVEVVLEQVSDTVALTQFRPSSS
jgi:uncharacterized protein